MSVAAPLVFVKVIDLGWSRLFAALEVATGRVEQIRLGLIDDREGAGTGRSLRQSYGNGSRPPNRPCAGFVGEPATAPPSAPSRPGTSGPPSRETQATRPARG